MIALEIARRRSRNDHHHDDHEGAPTPGHQRVRHINSSLATLVVAAVSFVSLADRDTVVAKRERDDTRLL
jgi:hypothetical protein